MAPQTESYQFKSEAQRLLDLMIHSLYSNKEIFLRELVSNSSDALDKLRFESLTRPELRDDDTPLKILIWTDPEARTITVSDNGIGMSREDAIENLGTIARSGTLEVSAAMAKAAAHEGDADNPEALSGQFGVGFDSTFMAATSVEVITRRAGEEAATLWRSGGDGGFEVGEAEREAPGTTATLTLREADPENGLPDFTDEWAIRKVVKKYSDFVTYPIELKVIRTETERDEEGNPVEGAEPVETVEWQTVNSMKAIWARSASEVTDEEYNEFYKHISSDWEPPFERIAFGSEGGFSYKALLFLPDRPPFDLFYRDQKFGLQLYVNRVLIKERADELLPDFLRFVKGVVDSPDLNLNVSREILQNDRRVGAIKKRVVRKVLDHLATVQKDDRERYAGFWSKFGRVLKEGVSDRDYSSKLTPLLWFETSDEQSPTSLAEYVERMPEGQEAIYYITGESRTTVERSPHLEAFKAKGYEVLYLTDPVDEILVGHLTEFEGKPLKSVGKGNVELGSEEERKEAEEARKEKSASHANLLERLQEVLDEHIKEVRLSARLTDSAVCLVGDEQDMSPQLEKLLSQHDAFSGPKQKRILEINPEHAILAKLQGLYEAEPEGESLTRHAKLLHGQALIAEGTALPDPVEFSQLVAELMIS